VVVSSGDCAMGPSYCSKSERSMHPSVHLVVYPDSVSGSSRVALAQYHELFKTTLVETCFGAPESGVKNW
jgi:hypothetical protein